MKPFPRSFYTRHPAEVAPELLGALLVRQADGIRLVGRIVEAEAYGADDPASHSFRGRTTRNSTMFGQAGHAYVYFTYGMHHCLNAVTDPASAVLIRAVEPLEGLDEMARRRGRAEPRLLCAGPGRLCQAFGLDREDDGLDLTKRGELWIASGQPVSDVLVTGRVGIGEAGADRPWRFVEAGSRFASRAITPRSRRGSP